MSIKSILAAMALTALAIVFVTMEMSATPAQASAPAIITPLPTPTAAPTKEERIKAAVLKELSHWFRSQGEANKTEDYLRPYLDSAWRVSAQVTGFPGDDQVDNALKLLCEGARESMFDLSFVQVNVPGMKIAGPLKIRFFSLDYGWVGINHKNIKWTYAVAKHLQSGIKGSKQVRQFLSGKTLEWMENNVRIPADLKLKYVDPSESVLVKRQYNAWKLKAGKGKQPHKFKFDSDFRERTKDDLDSMLYYRVIVEADRKARGWEWGYWHEKLYMRLHRVANSAALKQ